MHCSIRIALVGLLALGLQAASLKKVKDRKRAPDVELKDAAGNTVRISDFNGKVILLNFWATWCGPCTTEIPWFSEWAEKYKSEGLVVLGVSMDEEGWTPVKPFLEKHRVNYPIVLGSKRAAYLYGDVEELPVTFVIDRDHRIAAIHLGLAKKKEVENQIKTLLLPVSSTAQGAP